VERSDVAGGTPLSVHGTIFGTAVYMSPEQARGENSIRARLVLPRCRDLPDGDRKKPFANNAVTTLGAVLNKKPTPPLKLNPNLPPDWKASGPGRWKRTGQSGYPMRWAMKSDLSRAGRRKLIPA